MNVTVDNHLMGKMQCEDLGPKIQRGKIAYITGNLADLAGKSRYDGFNDCMAANYPDIQIVIGESKWDTRVAADAVNSILVANPDVKAIALAADSVYLFGTVAVLRSAGKLIPAGQDGHIYITSIDGSPDAMKAIRAGEADVTIAQPLPEYARLTAKYVKMALNGERISPGPTEHGSEIIAKSGVLYDTLTPILVNKANVDSDKLWGNLVQ
ncbi:D-ribose-binding periplasmic protein precursor [compost metagenome]